MSNPARIAPVLVAPSLPDALPPLTGDTAFLLPVIKRTEPLKVTIDSLWAAPAAVNEVVFYWKKVEVLRETVFDPDPSQFPMPFEISQIDLLSGALDELYYTVQTTGGTDESFRTELDLDNIAPNLGLRPAAIQFPQEILDNGVTESYLGNNGGKVVSTIARWPDIREADEVWYYLQPSAKSDSETAAEIGHKVISAADLLLPKIELIFTGDDFRALGQVNCVAHYFLKDRAGNEGSDSFDSPIIAIHLDPPLSLLRPEVPLYDLRGLIDEEAARTPVQVIIPAMTGIMPGDQIIIHWGSQHLPAQTITDPAGNPLLRVDVPYRIVQAAGNGTLLVDYDLWRAGASLGDSPDKQIEVDITLPGGPDPDPETPEHENLKLPVALGDSGVPNVISLADQELPAEVIIEWFGENGDEVFLQDDRLEALWASITLPYVILPNDVIAKQALKLPITSAQIKMAGQGTKVLSYNVTRDLPGHPGSSNTAYSRPQNFLVVDGTELPGGGAPLPPGDFPEKNQFNTINNAAAIDGTPYEIKLDYLNAAVGDIIEFKFRGHMGAGDDPALDPARPIEGSYTEDRHTVDQDDLDRGSYAFTVAKEYLNRRPGTWSGNGYHWISNKAGTAPGDAYYHVLVDVYFPTPSTTQASTKKRLSVAATLAALWSWLRCK